MRYPYILLILFICIAARADEIRDRIIGVPFTPAQTQFMQTENARTRALLDSTPLAQQITARGAELAAKNFPARVNYFGFDHMVKDGSIVRLLPNGTSQVLVPGSVLPKDAAFGPFRFSPDQKKLAFAFSFFGSDWQTWQIWDLEAQAVMPQEGPFTFKGFGGPGVSWTPDSKKILLPSDATLQQDFVGQRDPGVILHTLGTPSSQDVVLFKDLDREPSGRWGAVAVSNEKAVVFRAQGVATLPLAAFVVDFRTREARAIVPPNRFLGSVPGNCLVGVHGGKVYLRTAEVGNTYGILEVDALAGNPAIARKVIVPADPSRVLYETTLVGSNIIAQYHDHEQRVSFALYSITGHKLLDQRASSLGLPDVGSPGIPMTEADQTSTAAYFMYSSVAQSPATIRVNSVTPRLERMPDVAPMNFDPRKVVVQKIQYESFDHKKIDMWLYRRADLAGKPSQFAYLYSYGFIGIPNLPQWNRKFELALDLGAVVALPMLRGGGEHGADFHLEGAQNRFKTFLDLVHASRWLKQNEPIVDKRVVAVGRSFGGMTSAVHYVFNQKEFDLVSSIVPVTDWSTHFRNSGWWMADDFAVERHPLTGTILPGARERLTAFNEQWSPLSHVMNLAGKNLIPGIFFTSMFDTNTTPHQSIAFVSRLRQIAPTQPVFFFVHPNVGHAGRAELVDEMLFIAKQFGLTSMTPLTAQ